jgi:hypothetical protein
VSERRGLTGLYVIHLAFPHWRTPAKRVMFELYCTTKFEEWQSLFRFLPYYCLLATEVLFTEPTDFEGKAPKIIEMSAEQNSVIGKALHISKESEDCVRKNNGLIIDLKTVQGCIERIGKSRRIGGGSRLQR